MLQLSLLWLQLPAVDQVGAFFQQHVIDNLCSTALILHLHVEPGAVAAALVATLWRHAARTREVTSGTANIEAVTDIGTVRQTHTFVGVHATSTVPDQPDTQTTLTGSPADLLRKYSNM